MRPNCPLPNTPMVDPGRIGVGVLDFGFWINKVCRDPGAFEGEDRVQASSTARRFAFLWLARFRVCFALGVCARGWVGENLLGLLLSESDVSITELRIFVAQHGGGQQGGIDSPGF